MHNYARVYIETGEPVSPDKALGALRAPAAPAADVMLSMEICQIYYRSHAQRMRQFLKQRCVYAEQPRRVCSGVAKSMKSNLLNLFAARVVTQHVQQPQQRLIRSLGNWISGGAEERY